MYIHLLTKYTKTFIYNPASLQAKLKFIFYIYLMTGKILGILMTRPFKQNILKSNLLSWKKTPEINIMNNMNCVNIITINDLSFLAASKISYLYIPEKMFESLKYKFDTLLVIFNKYLLLAQIHSTLSICSSKIKYYFLGYIHNCRNHYNSIDYNGTHMKIKSCCPPDKANMSIRFWTR